MADVPVGGRGEGSTGTNENSNTLQAAALRWVSRVPPAAVYPLAWMLTCYRVAAPEVFGFCRFSGCF